MTSRRQFLSTLSAAPLIAKGGPARPNILFILTDDQGFGDLSIHGNKQLRTPNMDRIGAEGVQFTQFQVCPVCSPTRSGLMTGRYNYRTGVVDTYMGRSMMRPDELTLPEALRAAGYRTGIFGKWHLGDNYPMRAMDKGFEEALVIRGGGLAQPTDPPESNQSYFDPILQHNGKPERSHGYCTDVYTKAALEFIEKHRSEPFFAYVPTNAPHRPLQVDERYVAPFLQAGLDPIAARTYAMVANLDENIGRLLGKLTELKLERNTIVIFMTDNGPDSNRYNAGMRGRKGDPYQGGIRVPCFVRWPAKFAGGRTVDRIAANVDLFPTLLDACNVPLPKDRKLDGRSLLP
ncbi:MAG: arylsulfatase, partial [Acidobacteria bacterium]|nr:arylsulfatase [Acidobacteriota bacterium]